jgi:hypothetical protein
MNAITIQMPDELLKKVQLIAKNHDVALEDLIIEVMNATVRENEARARFEQFTAEGRGREQEALALLRR